MDVVWFGYAQVYVQYYSSVVVETTFVWVYSVTCTQWIIDPTDTLHIYHNSRHGLRLLVHVVFVAPCVMDKTI